MGVNYPASIDAFNEPTLPEETSLSSAGTGTRAHVEHHHDLGQAVIALETYASQRTHDHSGDSSSTVEGPKLLQANTHESPDTDSSPSALHHTIGTGANQAAAGDHVHSYNDLANTPWKLCTSTTRPGSPYPGLMIYETDTKRVRVWDTFPDNLLITGLNSIDNFDRVSAVDMGPTLWEQTYTEDPDTHGRMATPDGDTLSWIDGGTESNRCIARRIDPSDAETDGDDQVITWETGDEVIEDEVPILTTYGPSNDMYFRMSSDLQSYIRLRVGNDYVKLWYTVTGPDNEKHLGTLDNIDTEITRCFWRGQLEGRTFTLFRNGENLGAIKDTKSLSAKGPSYRGWGVGMEAGDIFLIGQVTPADIEYVRIQDLSHHTAADRWTLLPVANVPNCRLRQSKTQKLINTGSIIEWGQEDEDNFNFFDVLSSATDIIIRESGLYQIDLAIQWDPQKVPDVAHAIVMVNGVETDVRDQRFMRGNTYTPAFSQTLGVSGKLRLAENDVVQVKVKYTASGSLLDQIFSYFDLPSKINSRIDIALNGP